MFFVIIKQIGRALWRCLCAIGRFFKFLFKKIVQSFRTKKLNKKIRKNESDIQKLYNSIGEAYYNEHGVTPEPALKEFCDAVSIDILENEHFSDEVGVIKYCYTEEKAAAKEKARARRAEDKRKAQIERERVRCKKTGEEFVEPEAEPVLAPAEKEKKPRLSITRKKKAAQEVEEEAPAPVSEPIPAAEPIPEPVIEPVPEPEAEAISEPEPAPAGEPAPVEEPVPESAAEPVIETVPEPETPAEVEEPEPLVIAVEGPVIEAQPAVEDPAPVEEPEEPSEEPVIPDAPEAAPAESEEALAE